jgi:hypothetical protein
MRSGSKRFMIGMGTFLIAAALAGPSFAAKKVVSDDELDLVTAAGQPVVISVGAGSTVNFTGTTSIAQQVAPSSQQNLRALILNNVAGENQVHNGINIGAMEGVGTQFNTITQSWGSILDVGAVTASATATTSGGTCNTGALICKITASATATDARVTVLSKAADQIIHGDGPLTVTYNPVTNIGQDISENSQTGLVALIVNNVAGINQVATGINIANASVETATATLTIGAAAGGGNLGQTNTINQLRGTPAGFR